MLSGRHPFERPGADADSTLKKILRRIQNRTKAGVRINYGLGLGLTLTPVL